MKRVWTFWSDITLNIIYVYRTSKWFHAIYIILTFIHTNVVSTVFLSVILFDKFVNRKERNRATSKRSFEIQSVSWKKYKILIFTIFVWDRRRQKSWHVVTFVLKILQFFHMRISVRQRSTLLQKRKIDTY